MKNIFFVVILGAIIISISGCIDETNDVNDVKITFRQHIPLTPTTEITIDKPLNISQLELGPEKEKDDKKDYLCENEKFIVGIDIESSKTEDIKDAKIYIVNKSNLIDYMYFYQANMAPLNKSEDMYYFHSEIKYRQKNTVYIAGKLNNFPENSRLIEGTIEIKIELYNSKGLINGTLTSKEIKIMKRESMDCIERLKRST